MQRKREPQARVNAASGNGIAHGSRESGDGGWEVGRRATAGYRKLKMLASPGLRSGEQELSQAGWWDEPATQDQGSRQGMQRPKSGAYTKYVSILWCLRFRCCGTRS